MDTSQSIARLSNALNAATNTMSSIAQNLKKKTTESGQAWAPDSNPNNTQGASSRRRVSGRTTRKIQIIPGTQQVSLQPEIPISEPANVPQKEPRLDHQLPDTTVEPTTQRPTTEPLNTEDQPHSNYQPNASSRDTQREEPP